MCYVENTTWSKGKEVDVLNIVGRPNSLTFLSHRFFVPSMEETVDTVRILYYKESG